MKIRGRDVSSDCGDVVDRYRSACTPHGNQEGFNLGGFHTEASPPHAYREPLKLTDPGERHCSPSSWMSGVQYLVLGSEIMVAGDDDGMRAHSIYRVLETPEIGF